MKHRIATTMYAHPRKSFLPPNQLVVLKTMAFSPEKLLTGNTFTTLIDNTSPAYKLAISILRYNFLKVGRPAVLIQTMKSSSVTSGRINPPGPILVTVLFGIGPSTGLNLSLMSEDHAIPYRCQSAPVRNVPTSGEVVRIKVALKVSLKKLFAIRPQG